MIKEKKTAWQEEMQERRESIKVERRIEKEIKIALNQFNAHPLTEMQQCILKYVKRNIDGQDDAYDSVRWKYWDEWKK
jgi:hypothetical protein